MKERKLHGVVIIARGSDPDSLNSGALGSPQVNSEVHELLVTGVFVVMTPPSRSRAAFERRI
jgi:hypothetical protein